MRIRVQITENGESIIYNQLNNIAFHTGCEGFVETLSNVSYLKDVLYCKKCNLRVHIPKKLSWSDLIAYFKRALYSLDILECSKCGSFHYLTSEHIGQKCMLPDCPRNCDGILQRTTRSIIPPIV